MNISQYRKIKVIGRGAHGYAILCKRVKDNAKVVIKELFSHELSEEERKASMNEIQILSMLRHPNIIAYFDSFIGDVGSVFANNNNSNNDGNSKLDASMDVGNLNTMNNIPASPVSTTSSTDATQEKALMIVMEYADGGTLYEYLQKQTGDLSEHEVLHLFCQIALALHYVHSRNILHRDLKTTNIFISGNGVSKVLKIADFGISKVMNSNGKAETLVGTPSYLAPELCEGKSYNEKSDIWALGCILYELCCKKKLFEASNLPALVLKIMKGAYEPIKPSYSSNIANLFKWMVTLDPQKRPYMKDIIALPFLQSYIIDAQFQMGRLEPFNQNSCK